MSPALIKEDLFLLYLHKRYGLDRYVTETLEGSAGLVKSITNGLQTIGSGARHTPKSAAAGIQWPLRRFLQSQFTDAAAQKRPFASLITITGSNVDAQALTAGAYVSQTWPDIADGILELLPASLDHRLVPKSLQGGGAYASKSSHSNGD